MLLYLYLSANRITCSPTLCWVKGRWVKGPNTALEPQLLVESCESTDCQDKILLRTGFFSKAGRTGLPPYRNFRNPLDSGALCGLWVHQVCCDGGDLADWSCGLLIVISKSQLTTPRCCSSAVPFPSLSRGAWASPWELGHSFGGVSPWWDFWLTGGASPITTRGWTTSYRSSRTQSRCCTVTASLSSSVASSSFLSPQHRGRDTERITMSWWPEHFTLQDATCCISTIKVLLN